MWPFSDKSKKAVVVLHIDHDGHARGAWFRGNADVLIIDERDPSNRVYRMVSETPDDELLRKIGRHPLASTLSDKPGRAERPTLNLHWPIDGPQTA